MIVYFTTKTGNTKRFVNKLEYDNVYPIVPDLIVEQPFILVLGTYARNDGTGAVPPQVINFLNKNRRLIRGVVAGGNRNFGKHFAFAGDVVADKCKTELLHKFELFGNDDDVEKVRTIIEKKKLEGII